MSRHDFDASSGPDALRIKGLRSLVVVLSILIGTFVAWAHWAVLDRVTRAPGSVIASSRTQVIQSQEGGTIQELRVREGDTVDQGQLLVQIDKTRFQSQYLETRARAVGLGATVARLKAEVLGGQPQFATEMANYPEFQRSQQQLFAKRKSALEEETAALEGLRAIAQTELAMTEPLLQSGDVSRTDILRIQRQIAEIESQVTNRRNRYFQDAQSELNKAIEDLAGVEQLLAQRKAQLEATELRAPVKGVVKNVRFTTQGGVVRPGEEVMQIVPLEDDLLIEARLSPSDIAFIKPGLQVSVKIDAFDYTVYGDLKGKLAYISADTLKEDLRQGEEPYYRIQVRTEGRQFQSQASQSIDILPGMTALIEIKTGERSVLQYLLKPVVKTLSESLGER